MKFERFDFYMMKDDVYILPTFRISKQIELMDRISTYNSILRYSILGGDG